MAFPHLHARRTSAVAVVAALVLTSPLLAACGETTSETLEETRDEGPGAGRSLPVECASPAPDDSPAGTIPMPIAVPAACGEVRVFASLVIDAGDGPELCAGAVAMSYPPQCGGPELVGWSWDDVEFEDAGDIRFSSGGVLMTGTFDGTRFTLTGVSTDEAPDLEAWPEFDPDGPYAGREGSEEDEDQDGEEDEFATPCAPPAGGWKAVDPSRSGYDHHAAAIEAAQEVEGHVDTWVNLPKGVSERDLGETGAVLNLATRGDVEEMRRAVREHWGGALCVSTVDVDVSPGELMDIQDRVMDLPGAQEGSSDNQAGRVDVGVLHDDGSLQAWCDRTYGPGRVKVTSAIMPMPGR